MTLSLSALLIGRHHNLMWAIPRLLSKSGFQVDSITSSPVMKHSRFLRHCKQIAFSEPFIPAVIEAVKRGYDWIIVTGEETLQEILYSPLSVKEKLKLLPVCKEDNFIHLLSKIGLAEVLKSRGISVPDFVVAPHFGQVVLGAKTLGYPVMIKRSTSSGGIGVFECNDPSDLSLIPKEIFYEPVLVQKKIFGSELDLSALYFQGELVHFNYARQEKISRRFGPSYLRTYFPLSSADESIFQELKQIGKALGAHGFTNISCIETNERRRFYFEADMRPNAWVGFCQFVGEELSLRIQNWFSQRTTLSYPVPKKLDYPDRLLVPYFLRLTRSELLLNRYDVWRFIPIKDWNLVLQLIFRKMFYFSIKRLKLFFFMGCSACTRKKASINR